MATRRAIGEILVETGVVTPQQIREALRRQIGGDTRKLGEILVEMGFCATEDVTAALAEQAESAGMKVCLTAPELVDRRSDGPSPPRPAGTEPLRGVPSGNGRAGGQSGPSGRCLTTWQGGFEGTPDRWWREAFAMWAGEELQGVCGFRITTVGYEFECGEDEIDDIMEKLVAAAKKAGVTGDRNRAKERKHADTLALFREADAIKRELLAKTEAAEQAAERRKLQEQVARKFKSLEQ